LPLTTSINEILYTEALSIDLTKRALQQLSLSYKVKRENDHSSISQRNIRTVSGSVVEVVELPGQKNQCSGRNHSQRDDRF
jgi:hypothetical protein